jgi:hypothetical protein
MVHSAAAPGQENEPLPPDGPPPSLNGVEAMHAPAPLVDQLASVEAHVLHTIPSAASDERAPGAHAALDAQLMPPPPVPNMAAEPTAPAAFRLSLPAGNPPSGRSSYIFYDGEMERNPTGSDTQYHSSNSRCNSASSTTRIVLADDAPPLPARRSAAPRLINITTQPEQLPKSSRSAEDVQHIQHAMHPAPSASNADLDSAASEGAYTPKSSPMRPNFHSEHAESAHSPYAESGNTVPKVCVI